MSLFNPPKVTNETIKLKTQTVFFNTEGNAEATRISLADAKKRFTLVSNTGTYTTYIGFNNTVSPSEFNIVLEPGGLYQSPTNYTGELYAFMYSGSKVAVADFEAA